MEVKGIALKTTRDFVKKNFPDQYKNWHNNLPEPTRQMYDGVIDVTKWYPIKESYLVPIDAISKQFYKSDARLCGDTIGYFSAEVALKGIYKVFLLIAKPGFLIQRASKIISTYYRPSEVEAFTISSNSAGIRITEFKDMDLALEYRFGGWCKRALELSNCSGVKYKIEKSLAKGDECTEIAFSWE